MATKEAAKNEVAAVPAQTPEDPALRAPSDQKALDGEAPPKKFVEIYHAERKETRKYAEEDFKAQEDLLRTNGWAKVESKDE